MAIELYFRTLEGPWPREWTWPRRRKPFRTSLNESVRLLRYELDKLGSRAAVIQTAHPDQDMSVTLGRPRNDRAPAHPGVIVAADASNFEIMISM